MKSTDATERRNMPPAPALLSDTEAETLATVVDALLAKDPEAAHAHLGALLRSADPQGVFTWALGLVVSVTGDLYTNNRQPSHAQVYDSARKACTFAEVTYPHLTAGVIADIAEVALDRSAPLSLTRASCWRARWR